MKYLHWDQTTISDFSDASVALMYARGYVFTRIGRGVMHQTRSVRIDLSQFELSSENRRIIKKTDGLTLAMQSLPLSTDESAPNAYHWSLGKIAKDFYETKFGATEDGQAIMSANKIKELLTDSSASNFNQLLTYTFAEQKIVAATIAGYCIAYQNSTMLHYSYPFYDLAPTNPAAHIIKDLGMGMMLRAIVDAKNRGLQYIYLGSLQRPSDTYKLQFAGLEWFDGEAKNAGSWSSDIEKVKLILSNETNEK
jgi:arginyl-tRNA--protein-N-Asp/Glu arginylyltransferase